MMQALILNSGMGSRMGTLTSEHPKCMTEISGRETILSRQLRLLYNAGIRDIVITTGLFDAVLVEYCKSLKLPLRYTFVNNPRYKETNYIYSIYCARQELDDDLILMHGDLVFDPEVLRMVICSPNSCMAVSSSQPLPEKDFKAVVKNGIVQKVGIEFFTDAMEAQAMYHLRREDWLLWLEKIEEFCESGNTKVYAENALNELDGSANIFALDVQDLLCAEVDNPEDLASVREKLEYLKKQNK